MSERIPEIRWRSQPDRRGRRRTCRLSWGEQTCLQSGKERCGRRRTPGTLVSPASHLQCIRELLKGKQSTLCKFHDHIRYESFDFDYFKVLAKWSYAEEKYWINVLKIHGEGGANTEMVKNVCPRLRDIASGHGGDFTQPSIYFCYHLCTTYKIKAGNTVLCTVV